MNAHTLRSALAALLALALAACGTGRDTSAPGTEARPAATRVGELRRLLMLPVAYAPGSCRWPDAALRLDQSAVLFVRDWRGYEILRPARTEPARRLAHALAEWARDADAGARPPPPLRGELGDLAREAGADGVLVLAATPDCAGVTGKALGAIAGVVASSGAPLEGAVLDARSGTLLWRNAVKPALWEGAVPPSGPSPYAMQRAIEELYQSMDNAVPAVLAPAARPN
jgi:hypothetical protein